MKKIMIVTLCFFIIGGIVISLLFNIFKQPNANEEVTFRWLPEESYFVNYEITKKNTVKVWYSICFVNNDDEDLTISLYAKFKKKDVKGWLEYDFLEGVDDNGKTLRAEIKSGEKTNIIFVFEGAYLGGLVSENITFPEELIVSHSF